MPKYTEYKSSPAKILFFLAGIGIIAFLLFTTAVSTLKLGKKQTIGSKAAGKYYQCTKFYYTSPDCNEKSLDGWWAYGFCWSSSSQASPCKPIQSGYYQKIECFENNENVYICEDPNFCSDIKSKTECNKSVDTVCTYFDKCGKCAQTGFTEQQVCGTSGGGGSCTAIGAPCDPNAQPNQGGCCNKGSCGYSSVQKKNICFPAGAKAECTFNRCEGNKCIVAYYNPDPNRGGCWRPDTCGFNRGLPDKECGGLYSGNVCQCQQCPTCNTSNNPKDCSIDWNCVNRNPTCKANIAKYCGSGSPYSEDTASPATATFTNAGDDRVFTGPKPSYKSANWSFQWVSTPKGCIANFFYYAWKNNSWALKGSQAVSYQSCKTRACTFGANLDGSNKLLISLREYQNDQTGCTAQVSSVKMRY